MWVLDHLDDLESDFSVFHRVEDIHTLDGPRFFRMAWRLPAYDGVMRVRAQQAQDKQAPAPTALPSGPTPGPVGQKRWNTGFQTTSLEQADKQLGERREVRSG